MARFNIGQLILYRALTIRCCIPPTPSDVYSCLPNEEHFPREREREREREGGRKGLSENWKESLLGQRECLPPLAAVLCLLQPPLPVCHQSIILLTQPLLLEIEDTHNINTIPQNMPDKPYTNKKKFS